MLIELVFFQSVLCNFLSVFGHLCNVLESTVDNIALYDVCFQDYKGHIFCDQELWMLPPLVTFYPELAKIVLRSRSRYAAKKAAAQLAEDGGVKSSLKYPWQTGISGVWLLS